MNSEEGDTTKESARPIILKRKILFDGNGASRLAHYFTEEKIWYIKKDLIILNVCF